MSNLFDEFDEITNRVDCIRVEVDGVRDDAGVIYGDDNEVLIDSISDLVGLLEQAFSAMDSARYLWEEINENGGNIR